MAQSGLRHLGPWRDILAEGCVRSGLAPVSTRHPRQGSVYDAETIVRGGSQFANFLCQDPKIFMQSSLWGIQTAAAYKVWILCLNNPAPACPNCPLQHPGHAHAMGLNLLIIKLKISNKVQTLHPVDQPPCLRHLRLTHVYLCWSVHWRRRLSRFSAWDLTLCPLVSLYRGARHPRVHHGGALIADQVSHLRDNNCYTHTE